MACPLEGAGSRRPSPSKRLCYTGLSRPGPEAHWSLRDKSRDPSVILATSQAEIDSAKSRETALRRLETFVGSGGKVPPELAQLRLRLAASMGLYARAADAAQAMGIATIPMDLLAAAATASVALGTSGARRSDPGQIAE